MLGIELSIADVVLIISLDSDVLLLAPHWSNAVAADVLRPSAGVTRAVATAAAAAAAAALL